MTICETLQGKDPSKPTRIKGRRETWPQKVASISTAIRARSSACANSMRRASWCSRPGPTPSIWRNGGDRTASPPRPRSFDFRPGGVWRFVMHGPDGRDYQNRITFEEIVPPERIVYRHGGGDDVEPVQFKQTVVFEDLGGARVSPGAATSRRPRSATASSRNTAPTRAWCRPWRGSTKYVSANLGVAGNAARRQCKLTGAFIVLQTQSKDFVITRLFDAPRALVWECFTRARAYEGMVGPEGLHHRGVEHGFARRRHLSRRHARPPTQCHVGQIRLSRRSCRRSFWSGSTRSPTKPAA